MSSRRCAVVVLLLAAPLLAACGSSSGESDATAPAATTPVAADTTAAPAGGVAGAVEMMAGAIPAADAATCDIIRVTLETASQAYMAINGAYPTTQDELVPDLLLETSPQFEIAADGTIQPVATGPCVGH